MTKHTKQTILLAGAAATAVACHSAAMASAEPDTGAASPPVEYAYPNSYGQYLEAVPGSFKISGFYGITAAGPGEPGGFQGTETFDVYRDGTSTPLGSISAIVLHNYTAINPNLEVLVTGDTPASGVGVGTAAGELPPAGSVFNFDGADRATPTNTYMSLAGSTPGDLTVPAGTGDVVADKGNGDLWNTEMGFQVYDASAHINDHTDSLGPLPLPNGDSIEADPNDPETYSGITANSPWAVDVQGQNQIFDVLNPQGDVIGKFTGNVVDTADIFTGHSEEVWVTGGQETASGAAAPASDIGSAAGQIPTTGSVFNLLYYFSPNITSMYSDYNGTGPDGADQISKDWNIFGVQIDSTSSFDAVKGFTDGTNLFSSIPYQNGLTVVPIGTPDYTEINGLPNGITGGGGDTTMQGTQSFDVEDGNGNVLAGFTADITTYGDTTGKTDESLYVTSDGTTGSAPGDAPADGTEIEYTHTSTQSTLDVTHDPLAGNAPDYQEVFTPAGDQTISYDFDGAQLVQSTERTELAWAIPTTYTDEKTGETLTGTDFFRETSGGPNSEFVVTEGPDKGDIFALDRQIPGAPTMYFATGPGNPPGSAGVIDSALGKIDLNSSSSWLVEPADYSQAITGSEAFAKAEPQMFGALDLGPDRDTATGAWSATAGTMTPLVNPGGNQPIWSFDNTTFTNSAGDHLSGTAYIYSPLGGVGDYNEEFVTNSGAVYDENQGFLGFDTLYYNPGDGGPVTEIMQTPIGDWTTYGFTPPDYSDYVAAIPGHFVVPGDLIQAIDFGAAA